MGRVENVCIAAVVVCFIVFAVGVNTDHVNLSLYSIFVGIPFLLFIRYMDANRANFNQGPPPTPCSACGTALKQGYMVCPACRKDNAPAVETEIR